MPDKRQITKAIEAVPMSQRTPERIFDAIRMVVDQRPAAIGEIFPDRTLVKKAMSSKERTEIARKAAITKMKEAADKRYEAVLPIIREMLDEDPDTSLAKIKKRLDDSGHKPLRSKTWSRQAINYILHREGLRGDAGEPKET